MQKYTFIQKEKILKSIEKINESSYLNKISLIIQENNIDHPIHIEEDKGTTLFFENLKDNTYKLIEEVFEQYKQDKKNKKKIFKKHKLSDIIDINEQARAEEMRGLTNHEVTMMRRREYDETINNDSDKLELSDKEFTTIKENDSCTLESSLPKKKILKSKDTKDTKETKNTKDTKDTKETKNTKNTKNTKDTKETKNTKNTKDTKDTKKTKNTKDTKETKKTKNTKDTKETKKTKNTKDTKN